MDLCKSTVLLESLTQADSSMLRDEAIKHSNDANAVTTIPSDGGNVLDSFEKDAFAVPMVNFEDESTLNSISTISSQIFSTEILDVAIEDARNNKKTLTLTMESVMNLMREVECKEKAAEQAKEEAARSSLDILSKVDELKQAHQHAKEANDMHAREMYAQKCLLATEMKELQHHVVSLSDERNRSLGVLDEMRRALEMRLTAALIKKEAAVKEKLEKEASALEALAYQESQMEKVVEESKRLKREAQENSKLQEFLIDRGRVVDIFHGDISVHCQYVNLVKEELDQANLPSGLLFSTPTSCILSSSMSSLTTVIPCEPQLEIVDSYEASKDSVELADSYVFLEKNSGFKLADSNDASVPLDVWSVVYAEHQPLIKNTNSNLENEEGNKKRETEKPLRPIRKKLQRRCIKEECECKKGKLRKGIKRRIAVSKVEVIRKKRNKSGTKYLKNKEMKRWIKELVADAVGDYGEDDFEDNEVTFILFCIVVIILIVLNFVYVI